MAPERLFAAFVLLALLHFSSGAEFTVGDSSGWTFQVNYTQWASAQTFRVGDTLSFPYTSVHDVREVSRGEYDSCDGSNAIVTYATASPIRVSLSSAGEHWFLCGIPGHCDAGMKVPINVLAAASPADAPAPSPVSRAPSPRTSLSTPSPSPSPSLSPSQSPSSSPSPSPASSPPSSSAPAPSMGSPSPSRSPSPSPRGSFASPSPSLSESPRGSTMGSPSPSPSQSPSFESPSPSMTPLTPLTPVPSGDFPPVTTPNNVFPPVSAPSSSTGMIVSLGWGLTFAGLVLTF